MNAKQRRANNKKTYEQIKNIRMKVETGQTITFAERNVLHIYLKKLNKKKIPVQLELY